MILIDAIFINNGGGKILLDYLFEILEKEISQNITMLIDERIRQEYEQKKSHHIKFIFFKTFSERNRYYKTNGNQFTKVLCFGNIPPNIRLKAKVFTYFHQPMYLNIPKEFGIIDTIKFRLKVLILRRFSKNSDYWLVQSDFIKDKLIKKFNLNSSKVIKLAFYPPFKDKQNYEREANSFIYISNANPHKNHTKLINAFCKFYDKYETGKLILTVNDSFSEVKQIIIQKQSEGYPIENLGFIHREELYKYYKKSEYLIFPSMAESFGLGIVEAIENGCKVIGADLPYMHEACTPSLTFNPNAENSIYENFVSAINSKLPDSVQKIYNQKDKLIKLLTNNQINEN